MIRCVRAVAASSRRSWRTCAAMSAPRSWTTMCCVHMYCVYTSETPYSVCAHVVSDVHTQHTGPVLCAHVLCAHVLCTHVLCVHVLCAHVRDPDYPLCVRSSGVLQWQLENVRGSVCGRTVCTPHCVQQCVCARRTVCGSAHGSVRRCGSAWQCGSVR
jgi:hypothetical protein